MMETVGKLVNMLVTNLGILLRLVVYPIIYKVLVPSQVVVWDFWTINNITIENIT